MMDFNDVFNTEVEVEINQLHTYNWKTNIQWKISIEAREYGIKSLSPYSPNQFLDLTNSISDYIEEAEQELQDAIDHCQKSGDNPDEDKEIAKIRREIETAKGLTKLEIKDVDCILESSDSDDSSSLSLFPVRIEIDLSTNRAKLFFQK